MLKRENNIRLGLTRKRDQRTRFTLMQSALNFHPRAWRAAARLSHSRERDEIVKGHKSSAPVMPSGARRKMFTNFFLFFVVVYTFFFHRVPWWVSASTAFTAEVAKFVTRPRAASGVFPLTVKPRAVVSRASSHGRSLSQRARIVARRYYSYSGPCESRGFSRQ